MPEAPVLKIATCLWQANTKSKPFSSMYDESWVEKLYRGFRRNLTAPFRFTCFTDRKYDFKEPILQVALEVETGDLPDYGCMIQPFVLDGPMIVVGLDTIVVASIDEIAGYCFGGYGGEVALPRDPYDPSRSINGVALVPPGNAKIHDEWDGGNDMVHLRKYKWTAIDDLWPNQVVSLKANDVRRRGLCEARIVYFHGDPKPDKLTHLSWVQEHWR